MSFFVLSPAGRGKEATAIPPDQEKDHGPQYAP